MEDPISLQKLVPVDMSFVQYVHHRMVSRGGYAKAEKERKLGLSIPSGLDTIRDANRAKDSKLQALQEKSDQTKAASVRVHCAKCKSVMSEFEDTNPTWEKKSGAYISRKRTSCRTQGCCDTYTTNGKKKATRRKEVDFVPVDKKLPFVYARNLSAKK